MRGINNDKIDTGGHQLLDPFISIAAGADCGFRCGNGLVDAAAGETCDDGNTTPGDGCDANCQVET